MNASLILVPSSAALRNVEYATSVSYSFPGASEEQSPAGAAYICHEAHYQFSKWDRFRLVLNVAGMQRWQERCWGRSRSVALLAFEIGAGYGMPRRLVCSALALLLIISIMNWMFAYE